MEEMDAEFWSSGEEPIADSREGDTVNRMMSTSNKCKDSRIIEFITFVCTFLLMWQTIFRVADIAVQALFKFFGLVLLKLNKLINNGILTTIVEIFPNSLVTARKFLNIDRNDFHEMIVCPKCHSTYSYEDCFKYGITTCVYVRFPKHPQQKMRSKCLTSLLKTVKLSSGGIKKLPIKLYYYKSIINELALLLNRDGCINLINKWRERNIPDNYLADIYDGQVWKNFKDIDGRNFFLDRYSLGLLINVDLTNT
ncbi:MAG: hypothetical protein GKR90_28095 [Pseudomonadales bacterium]|nr:hypothetical protein [Pseudomonadales bacterium]